MKVEGEYEKLKRGRKYGARSVFLKREGGGAGTFLI